MKPTIRLTIDLEVRKRRWRWLPLFHIATFAKATYEGKMELGDIKIGETLCLGVFNSFLESEFVVREIRRTPVGATGETVELIELYTRSTSCYLQGARLREHTVAESAHRLRTQIRDNLSKYGLVLQEETCRVGPEPTYIYLPSNVGADKLLIATLSCK